MDRAFYVQDLCPRCAAEVLPKERHCGQCGAPLDGGATRLAAELARASAPARLAATLLDGLALLVVYEVWLSFGWGEGAVPLAALALAWWALLPVGAGQTLGQHVMGQVVLTQDRRPLSLRLSLLRTLASLACWPLLGPLWALWRPDGATLPEAWTQTRTWSERGPGPSRGGSAP